MKSIKNVAFGVVQKRFWDKSGRRNRILSQNEILDFASRRFWASEIKFVRISNSPVGSNDHQNRSLTQSEISNDTKNVLEILLT